MATILSNLVVSVGNRLSDAKAANAAVDNPRPVVSWVLPSGFKQARYSVLLQAVEADSSALATSGPQPTNDQWWQLAPGLALSESFNGLCTATVSVSTQTSGDFEYVSNPCYFVFGREVDRFVNANDLLVKWHKPLDPDLLPNSPPWEYQVDIASDVLFNQLIYSDASGMQIPVIDPSAYVSHDIQTEVTTPNYPQLPVLPPEIFLPNGQPGGPLTALPRNVPYFYRVRAWDGMDWGPWSHVRTFYNLGQVIPQFKFISATPQDNGDVIIVFRIDGVPGAAYSAAISFTGGPKDWGDPEPVELLESTTSLPAGTWAVTWRSVRELGFADNSITLYGFATDGFANSNTDIYGPVNINNSSLFDLRSNFGSLRLDFPVISTCARLRPASNELDFFPVNCDLHSPATPTQALYPIQMGKYAWWQTYLQAPCETYNLSGMGHPDSPAIPNPNDRSNHALFWPEPVAAFSIFGGPAWADAYPGKMATDVKRYITVSQTGFIFIAPVDNTNPTTLPTPMASKDMSRNQYLRGYVDWDGTKKDYPNEYDWNSRPAWHIGREVYDTDDAWVQVAYFKYTNLHACQTCHGNHWVVSSGPPYYRTVCPNPNCFNGFDLTTPILKDNGVASSSPQYKQWIASKAYIDVKWYRLSTFLTGTPFTIHNRTGLPIAGAPYLTGIQYIIGRQLSNLDGKNKDNRGNPAYYEITQNNQVRRLPKTTPVLLKALESDLNTIDPSITLTHREDGLGEVRGAIVQQVTNSFDIDQTYPSAIGVIAEPSGYESQGAVQGEIVDAAGNFRMGGPPADSNPLHAIRPAATQPGSIAVSGSLGRSYSVNALSFRFLPAWWDAYNTLHIAHTGSDHTKFQIQYAAVLPNGSMGNWTDVQGGNATLDQDINAFLVDPLKFHEYWDTSLQSLFPNGQNFKLRVRLYDDQSGTNSAWVYSHTTTILHDVANPANMTSMVYEPWAKTVTITFRLDDTQHDTYNLTRFWYSADDGQTWNEIARGDIYGSITNLTSGTGNDASVHSIIWATGKYNLQAGDDYRVQMECIPTQFEANAQLPYFQWLTPRNPIIDEAERTLADVMGRVETISYDSTAKRWVKRPTPIFNPGQLRFDQLQIERVRRDVGTTASPSGIYNFVTVHPPNPLPGGSIPDISGAILPNQLAGYNAWLADQYSSTETHGQALARLNAEVDKFIRVTIPTAEQQIIDGERAIRRNLINQGYYAEAYFQGALPSGIVEQVYADVIGNLSGNDTGAQALRTWAFRVQSMPSIGDGLGNDTQFNADGLTTTFERVFYKVQLDPHADFASQPHSQPLREYLYNFDGSRLLVASFYGGKDIRQYVNSSTIVAADQQTGPWTGQATDQNPTPALAPAPAETPVLTMGANLKVAPADLPGQHDQDILPLDMTKWDGVYNWRVAAYNAINGPNTAAPRPLISTVVTSAGVSLATVAYTMQAPDRVILASLTDFSVSNSYLPVPSWQAITALNYVSDRRAPFDAFASSSTRPWIPVGFDRPHPCLFWDDEKQMYMVYTTKLNNANEYRIINSRAQKLPDVCEYQDYFESDPNLGIYRPTVLKALNKYWMFVTVQPPSSAAYIGVSTSVDGETWSTVQPIAFANNGVNPCVVFRNNIFHLFYENFTGGRVQIVYARSTDGFSFTMQNGGLPVYGEATSVGCPGVVFNNGAWIMYLNDATGHIISVVSTDGISWSNRQVELSVITLTLSHGADPVQVVPKNPFPFFDIFQGNRELMLAFNYQPTPSGIIAPSGTNYVYTARLEDRAWVAGRAGKLQSLDDSLSAITSSRDGVSHGAAVDLLAHGMLPTDPIKVRLNFTQVSPATIEYHRQSAWVTPSTLPDDQSVMSPDSFDYNSALLNFPYLRINT